MIIIDTTVGAIPIIHPSRTILGSQVDVQLYDMQHRIKETSLVSAIWLDGELSFSYDFEGVEGNQYFLKVVDNVDNKLLFTTRVFCTDQVDLQDYSMTDGEFKTPTQSDNEFLTY